MPPKRKPGPKTKDSASGKQSAQTYARQEAKRKRNQAQHAALTQNQKDARAQQMRLGRHGQHLCDRREQLLDLKAHEAGVIEKKHVHGLSDPEPPAKRTRHEHRQTLAPENVSHAVHDSIGLAGRDKALLAGRNSKASSKEQQRAATVKLMAFLYKHVFKGANSCSGSLKRTGNAAGAGDGGINAAEAAGAGATAGAGARPTRDVRPVTEQEKSAFHGVQAMSIAARKCEAVFNALPVARAQQLQKFLDDTLPKRAWI